MTADNLQGLYAEFRCLRDDFDRYRKEMDEFVRETRARDRTPWGVLATCSGLLILILGIVFAPYRGKIDELSTVLAAHVESFGSARFNGYDHRIGQLELHVEKLTDRSLRD